MKKNKALTAENLKQILWETLQGVRSKRVDPVQANAVASTSREIMRVIRTEIDIARITGEKFSGFLAQDQKRKALK